MGAPWGPHGAPWGPMGPMGAPMGAPMGPPWAPCGQPACRPAGNPAFIFRGVISPKQRPKIWQGISPTVCQNASWTHLVVFSRRFYIGRTEGELTIFHQTPISSTDTIDFCSTGHFQVGAKSSFFRGVISGKQSQIVFSTDFWPPWGGWRAAGGGRRVRTLARKSEATGSSLPPHTQNCYTALRWE